jgi:glyoxylase-like metal-dependent hydrolase (beta-lactamase superfamily II)
MPSTLVVISIIIGMCAAQESDLSKVQIKVSKVAGNVYMLVGPMNKIVPWVGDDGNIAADFGDDGIVLVDVEHAGLGPKIQAALKSIADEPVRFVILTHYHDDHVGGSAYFQKSALVIAHDNVRKRMENGSVAGDGATRHPVKPQPKDALPIITFDHDLTLHVAGEDIRVMYFPAAHTDGDSIVFFPKSNVVHVGDLFVTYGFPFVDLESGGSIDGMIDALDKVIAQMPADVKVIPGHGPASNLEDMRAFVKMLKETRAAVQSAIARGETLDQMLEAKLLSPWQRYDGILGEDAFLKTLYASLSARQNGRPLSALDH